MDKKARRILLKTYWGTNGWRFSNLSAKALIEQGFITVDEFEYAKSKGLMFDDVPLSHEACLQRLKDAASKITMKQLTDAFLSSLSTRNIHLRSAISSFRYANRIEVHKFKPALKEQCEYHCKVCKNAEMLGSEVYSEYDLNVLNFERIKWGGIRFNSILYCMLDLEQFILEDHHTPTDMDLEIFQNILRTIESSKSNDAPRQLEKSLKDVLPSNKDERDILIETLAHLDILKPTKLRPTRGKNDWGKVEDWRGEDGYNRQAVEALYLG